MSTRILPHRSIARFQHGNLGTQLLAAPPRLVPHRAEVVDQFPDGLLKSQGTPGETLEGFKGIGDGASVVLVEETLRLLVQGVDAAGRGCPAVVRAVPRTEVVGILACRVAARLALTVGGAALRDGCMAHRVTTRVPWPNGRESGGKEHLLHPFAGGLGVSDLGRAARRTQPRIRNVKDQGHA